MSPIRSLFLVGTDTGVGKTTLAEGLLRLAFRRGVALAPYKPAESGTGPEPESSSDAKRLLLAAADPGLTLPMVSPYRLTRPLAPSLAARLDSRVISQSRLIAGALQLLRDHPAILVESAGGLLSPYGPRATPASLAQALSRRTALDVVLVAANRLGAINQCALAGLALQHFDLTCAGIVLTQTLPSQSTADAFNAGEIAAATDLPVLGTLRFMGPEPFTAEETADALVADIDLRPLFSGRLGASSPPAAGRRLPRYPP